MKPFSLRPRGVLFLRRRLREGLAQAAPRLGALAAAAVLAGCATPPQTALPDAGQVQPAPATSGIEMPRVAPAPSPDPGALRERLTGIHAAPYAGRRINAPLAREEVSEGLALPVIDLTVQPPDVWSRIRRGFAVPNIDTPLVREWEAFYAARPDYLLRTAERAGKYLYYIVEEIDQRGMPTELALLPFIESAYNPQALSRVKASGLWQFMPATGRGYNLRQDWWRDERRDPVASTNAALDYMRYLFDFHGDWHLALASYNWGEGSVKRAIDKKAAQGLPTDYLSLDMPDETRNYIPKLQAIKNIVSRPSSFGVVLPVVDNQPYFVTITKTRNIDVQTAAKLAEMPLDEFKALNPSFHRGVILGQHQPTLQLPADRVAVFEENLRNHQGALSSWRTHRVGRGDTVASVAREYQVPLATLRRVNGLGTRSKLAAGDVLLVPGRGAQLDATVTRVAGPAPTARGNAATSSKRPQAARAPAPRSARTHTVQRGDTLSSIARRYGTTVGELRTLNRIGGAALPVGRSLRIPGGRG